MRLDRGVVRFIVDAPADDDDGVIRDDELPEPIEAVYPKPSGRILARLCSGLQRQAAS